jgi:dTMP kinase
MNLFDAPPPTGLSGLFLGLDGVDGAGKTTQCRQLAEWLTGQGHAVTVCRDPGGTPVGDQIRSLLLDRAGVIEARTELFLFMASRSALVEQVIRPALELGRVVIVDRFVLSTVVYQGHAGGMNTGAIWELGRLATGGLLPELTLVLDLPVNAAQARKSGPVDRMEAKGAAFLEQVREGFLAEARRWPQAVRVIDADRPVDAVQADLRAEVARVLASRPRA